MGIIREPLDVDFVVEPKLLSKAEKKKISAYIKAYKARHSRKKATRKRNKAMRKTSV